MAYADGLHALCERDVVLAAVAQPAVRADGLALGVDADNDLVAVLFYSLGYEFRVADSRRADDNARNTQCKHGLYILHGANAAAKLHGRAGLADDLLHHAVVRVRAVLRGVKIHHVYKVCTGIEEPLCGLDRVFCYFMCSAVVAFLQAHALTVFQINRGDNSHFPTSVSFAKLRSIASPTSPLFSG